MAIPEQQLETWSHPGAQVNSTKTYTSIRAALESVQWPDGKNAEIYLQGSYKNDTNIYGESDVDVVVCVQNYFISDVSDLTEAEKEAQKATVIPAPNAWENCRTSAMQALEAYYKKQQVNPGRIAIKVDTPFLTGDVVVAIEHRKYTKFISLHDQHFYPGGVTFKTTTDHRWIVNYPKAHFANGQAKNGATKQWYKPVVRVFKNAYSSMVDKGIVPADVAFSYAIECMVYSAPVGNFGTSYVDTFVNVYNWVNNGNLSLIRRVSEAGPLIGTDPEQWKLEDAQQFVDGLYTLWTQW
jgi:hypothetical protein